MPKVSVVLPCYNVAPYIGACLDSLLNQTLADIEVICVDDKSTDDTVTIIKKYARKDNRITLIELPQNQGVSNARNIGIDTASGEYIGFVDPDDYVDLDFYEKLYDIATKNNADIAKAALTTVNVDGIYTQNKLNWAVKQNKLNFQYEFTSAIFRKEFLDKNNLRFLPGISIGEDVNFQIKAAYLANKIPVIDSTTYMYIRREDSALSAFLTRNKIEKVCIAADDLVNWINIQGNLPKEDYLNLIQAAYGLLTRNVPRSITQQDKELIAQHIIAAYKNSRYKKDILRRNFKPHTRIPVAMGQIAKIIRTLAYNKRRYKLFGCIPVVKVLHAPKQEYKVILFDLITLFRCVRGQWNDNFYICGIRVMKIAH